jgi:hypothetical protein
MLIIFKGKPFARPLVAPGQKTFSREKTKGSFNNRMSLEIPQSG